MRILVTGASGFIGSRLVELLEEIGYDTIGLYRYVSDGRYNFYKPSNMVYCDIRDEIGINKLIKEIEPDTIINLAAITPVSYSFTHPMEVTQINYLGVVNIANAALKHGVKHFIHASTSEVYGTQEVVPTPEDTPLRGDSPYSVAKIAAEEYLKMLDTIYGFNYTIIRPFNTYGRALVKKRYYVVERAITQALETGKINLYNSKPIRVFMFREDHVDGYVRCVGNRKTYKQIINLSTDQAYSIREMTEAVAAEVETLTRKKIPIGFEEKPDRPYEIPTLWGTNKKAKELLNWTPEYNLHLGIKKAIKEWQEALH